MSIQFNPQVAQAIMQERTRDIERAAERARILRGDDEPRRGTSVRAVVLTIAGVLVGVVGVLQLG